MITRPVPTQAAEGVIPGDHSMAGSQRICDLCVAKRRDDVDREITDAYQRDLDTLKKITDDAPEAGVAVTPASRVGQVISG
ncbi:hypothetical protein [Dactylosporangium sp. NPDC048998]|uniref:hypothetical protein n=1 Tax=Dactylosporangium sp. NPDC048998 TaxID=3363976 RepID=UPI00371263C0